MPKTTEVSRETSGQAPRLRGVRVMFVLPSLGFGGAEHQAFLLARNLRDREGAQLRLVGLGPSGGIAARCKEAGIPSGLFDLRHGYRKRMEQALDVVRFVRFLRSERAHVVLPYCMFQNILCGLTWRLGGANVCIWNQRDEGRSRLEPWIERLAVRQVRCFVSNSRHGAEFLTGKLRVKPERVHVLHNGVEIPAPEISRSAWRAKLSLSEEAFVACMVANLHSFKDHATLVTAWRSVVDRLRPRGMDAHLLLAGLFGDRYEAVTRQVVDLALSGQVHFLGEVRDISGLLASVDLGVFSSNAEGVPNAILEAMAAGLAVVGTDYPGIQEAVGPEGTPLLSRPRDPVDLAEKIVTAALDAGLRASLGESGKRRVETEFAVRTMCDRMVERILAEWRGRRPAPGPLKR